MSWSNFDVVNIPQIVRENATGRSALQKANKRGRVASIRSICLRGLSFLISYWNNCLNLVGLRDSLNRLLCLRGLADASNS